MPQPINVVPSITIYVLRGDREVPLSEALQVAPGASELFVVRLRNFNPSWLPAVGSLAIIPNGATIAPQVMWGEGKVVRDGEEVGAMQRPATLRETARALAPGATGNPTANVVISWGKYMDLRFVATWPATGAAPSLVFGPEDTTPGVPLLKIEGEPGDDGGFAAIGMAIPVTPEAPAGTT